MELFFKVLQLLVLYRSVLSTESHKVLALNFSKGRCGLGIRFSPREFFITFLKKYWLQPVNRSEFTGTDGPGELDLHVVS